MRSFRSGSLQYISCACMVDSGVVLSVIWELFYPRLHLCTTGVCWHARSWVVQHVLNLNLIQTSIWALHRWAWIPPPLLLGSTAEHKNTYFYLALGSQIQGGSRWCVLHLSSLQRRWAPKEVTCATFTNTQALWLICLLLQKFCLLFQKLCLTQMSEEWIFYACVNVNVMMQTDA